MRSTARHAAALALLFLLAGCAATGPTPVTHIAPLPPTPTQGAGLAQVIGADMSALVRLFGTPALDLREGTARKLQFQGPACVLDAYLYPPQAGAPPRVTWIDSRTPVGLPIDKASCIAALAARRR